jgi:electron transfer flavoprotein beta subunit
VPAIINPFDLFALEEALRLKDQHGGRVTVISMGPPQAEDSLKKCLSYGADEAILITDKVFAGADTLATTYVLASAISQLNQQHPIDIVLTGKQTIDGDTAQVGPGIATRLGFQLLTYISKVRELNVEKKQIIVERRAEGGVQVLQSQMPCVMTLLEGINEIRFATMPNMLRAARTEITQWHRAEAGITELSKVGLKGSPTFVAQVFAPKPRSVKATMISGTTPQEMSNAFVDKLFTDHPDLKQTIQQHLEKRA